MHTQGHKEEAIACGFLNDAHLEKNKVHLSNWRSLSGQLGVN